MTGTGVDALDDEVLVQILSNLECKDLGEARATQKSWSVLLAECRQEAAQLPMDVAKALREKSPAEAAAKPLVCLQLKRNGCLPLSQPSMLLGLLQIDAFGWCTNTIQLRIGDHQNSFTAAPIVLLINKLILPADSNMLLIEGVAGAGAGEPVKVAVRALEAQAASFLPDLHAIVPRIGIVQMRTELFLPRKEAQPVLCELKLGEKFVVNNATPFFASLPGSHESWHPQKRRRAGASVRPVVHARSRASHQPCLPFVLQESALPAKLKGQGQPFVVSVWIETSGQVKVGRGRKTYGVAIGETVLPCLPPAKLVAPPSLPVGGELHVMMAPVGMGVDDWRPLVQGEAGYDLVIGVRRVAAIVPGFEPAM